MAAALRILYRWSVVVVAAMVGPTAFAFGTVDVAMFDYPPIYQAGSDKGVAGDIVVAAFRAMGTEVDVRFLPPARMIKYVAEGKVSCAVGGRVLFDDPAVASEVSVGSLILFVSQTFLYDKRRFPNGLKYSHLSDLRELHIGALSSSGIMGYLQRTGNLRLHGNTTHEGLSRQLQAGRIDLWATVDLTGYHYMRSVFGGEAENFDHTASFNRGDVSFVCSRTRDPNGVYIRQFADGLARIKRDGTFIQIMAKYYGGRSRINPDSLPDDIRRRITGKR
ncbi:MAG: uncharacterized protein H6R01_185 [Burkholderiaceae bacterium]|nr:uncharacterized protein [Burkholderiaceae bacterium]